MEVKFNYHRIKITSPYWFLHSVDEIFVNEVYRFESGSNNPYILDCGANYGLSVIYFKKLFPDCTITAFEPDRKIYEILSSNISKYNFKDVTLINSAIWKENAQLEFAAEGSLGGTILQLGTFQMNKCIIDALELKPFLLEKTIDFLKIDIEGAEYEVLKSCKDNLYNVKNMFVEYHSDAKQPQMLFEILEIIKYAGFRYYIKEAWNNMNFPFIDHKKAFYYDLQLNIFCYKS